MYRVVMVCMGNICRSPTAEAVLRHRVEARGLDIEVSSAGTGGWHVGDGADPRSQRVLEAAGYTLDHAARQFRADWFDRYDLVVCMDQTNLSDLRALRRDAEVHLLREWDGAGPGDVPDPYHDDAKGFASVLAMVERSCDGLVEWLVTTGRVSPRTEA